MKKSLSAIIIILGILAIILVIFNNSNRISQIQEGRDGGSLIPLPYSGEKQEPSNSPAEPALLTDEQCAQIQTQKEKDDCWTKLANQIFIKEENEAKAAEICKRIIDIQSHDSCLDDISFDMLETCEAMKTKESNPEDWYNDCIDFVAYYAEDCLRIKNDDKLESECIEFVAETPEDCDLIVIENIKERCKRNLK